MINIITQSGKRIGKISDDMSADDVIYVDGRPVLLSDVYNDMTLLSKFNDEVKNTNGIKLEDQLGSRTGE